MSLFSIGQILRISADEGKTTGGEIFKTRVADLDNENLYLEIPHSEKNGKKMLVNFKSLYNISFYDQNRSNYHFQARFQGYKTENNLTLLVLQKPKSDEIVKDQKRGFLRVNANLDLAVQLRTFDRNIHIVTKTLDLSGGGLSFITSTDNLFRPDDSLQLWLVIGTKDRNIKRFAIKADVVRVHQPDETKPEQIVSVKFTNLKESENLAIIRYCFERQIELKKK